LEQEKGVLESTCNQLSEKLKQKTSEYGILQQKYQRKLNESTGKRKKPAGTEENKELLNSIENQSKGFLFSKQKFANSAAQEANLGKLMLRYGTIPNDLKNDKKYFIDQYSSVMRKVIFERRSYVQTEYRKIFLKLHKDKTPFPSVEDLTKCLAREIETDAEYEVFVFYCEELLGKMVGASEWAPKIRCFNTISGAIRQNTKVPLISPSDEAFAVLLVANCIDRWTEEVEEDAARPSGDPKPKKNVNGRYTKCDAGQSKYGGWSPEGLKHYNDLLALSKESRESPRCVLVEEKCREILRQKHKIKGKTWEEHSQRKQSRKRNREEGNEETGPEVVEDEEILADMEMISSDEE
jgi:hypothetical protein